MGLVINGRDVILQIIGDFSNKVNIPYVFGNNSLMGHLNTVYYHIHGEAFVYPRLANSISITSGIGVWDNTGIITEIIPVNTLGKPFDIHWVNPTNITANLEGLIEIFSGLEGVEIKIGETKIVRNTIFAQENAKRIQIPQQLKNTRISCRFSDNQAGANSVDISFEGHYYG